MVKMSSIHCHIASESMSAAVWMAPLNMLSRFTFEQMNIDRHSIRNFIKNMKYDNIDTHVNYGAKALRKWSQDEQMYITIRSLLY